MGIATPFGPTSEAKDPANKQLYRGSRPGSYDDVTFTNRVWLRRAGQAHGYALYNEEDVHDNIAVLNASAPNLSGPDPWGRTSERFDEEGVNRILTSMMLLPRLMQPNIATHIGGALGCGAFHNDPDLMANLQA